MLGWKYVAAEEESQRYKVGKFILETRRVCRTTVWEGDEGELVDETPQHRRKSSTYRMPPNDLGGVAEEDEIEFDSQDEDECEDLFMGVWTPELAMKRRRAREFAQDDE